MCIRDCWITATRSSTRRMITISTRTWASPWSRSTPICTLAATSRTLCKTKMIPMHRQEGSRLIRLLLNQKARKRLTLPMKFPSPQIASNRTGMKRSPKPDRTIQPLPTCQPACWARPLLLQTSRSSTQNHPKMRVPVPTAPKFRRHKLRPTTKERKAKQ